MRIECRADASGRTFLSRQSFRAPIHLSKPHWDGHHLIVNIVNPTAGLFAGDSIELAVHVCAGARVVLTSPSAARVFRAKDSVQSTQVCNRSSSNAEEGSIFFQRYSSSWGSAVFSNDKNRAPRRWRAVFHRDDGTGTHGFGRGVRLRPTGLRDRPVACRQAGARGKGILSPRTTGLCQPGESAFRTPTTRPRSSFQKGWAGTPCGRSSLPSVRPPSSRERVTQPQVSAPSKSSPRTAFRCVPPSPGCVPSGMPFSESRNRVCASCRGPPARPRRTQPPR